MSKELTTPQKMEGKSSFLLSVNALQSCEKVQRQVKIARAMKAMQYDFIAIFEATGLQPEIIQSL